jgi:hypothetical protein
MVANPVNGEYEQKTINYCPELHQTRHHGQDNLKIVLQLQKDGQHSMASSRISPKTISQQEN